MSYEHKGLAENDKETVRDAPTKSLCPPFGGGKEMVVKAQSLQKQDIKRRAQQIPDGQMLFVFFRRHTRAPLSDEHNKQV